MKGIRFYEELENKGRKAEKSQGNVIATIHESHFWRDGVWRTEALVAVYFRPDSPVGLDSVDDGYLRSSCRRVSEARARQIHPALFRRLDMD